MIDLTAISLADFLCESNLKDASASPLDFSVFREFYSKCPYIHPQTVMPGYVLWDSYNQKGDVAVFNDADLVAVYTGNNLRVADEHQGKGLSTAMILRAVKYRTLPTARSLSPGGKAALTKAWKVANGLS